MFHLNSFLLEERWKPSMAKLSVSCGDNIGFVEDSSVDFILTDPPFNISKETNFHTYRKNRVHSYQFDGESGQPWDTYTHEGFLTLLDGWAQEWRRVLRRGGGFAVFCADTYVSHLMEAMTRNGLSPRRVVVWRKNNAVPVNRAYMPLSGNEYVVVGVKKGGKSVFNADVPLVEQGLDERIVEATVVADKVSTIVSARIRESMLSYRRTDDGADAHVRAVEHLVAETLEECETEVVGKVRKMYKEGTGGEKFLQACIPNYVQNPLKTGGRLHPTEKPVPLLQYFVSLYTVAGDTVLDGFGGSGSSGEAALSLGRDAIVVEQDREFYGKLVARLTPYASEIVLVGSENEAEGGDGGRVGESGEGK